MAQSSFASIPLEVQATEQTTPITDPAMQGGDRGGAATTKLLPSAQRIRRFYFQAFAVTYLIAFLSMWTQLHALVGSRGLLPVTLFFQFLTARLGFAACFAEPSLLWLGTSDAMLHFWCVAGTALSVLLFMGLAPRLVLILLWAVYLSLCVAGQEFFRFQWDTLLLEMTVCSLFYAPRGLRPDWRRTPDQFVCWPLWALSFKLMFLSGVTKLLSGDAAWSDGSALEYHFYTQPIPSWPAWYAYQCPRILDRLALLVMFAVEVVAPFLMFVGRRGRACFGVATMGLMVAIEALGNFGFFNLQTMVLCLPLFDDDLLQRVVPILKGTRSAASVLEFPVSIWRNRVGKYLVAALLSISLLTMVAEVSHRVRLDKLPSLVATPIQWADKLLLSWGSPLILETIGGFRSINGYGLFRVMTTQRHEIVFETSEDGDTWTACDFRYKPGAIDRAPPIIAPHMPRLDWQMWFAALRPEGNRYWLGSLARQILEGNSATARMFQHPEWESHPPRWVRLVMYDYKFTSADQRRNSGAWWNRTFLGNLTQPMSKPAAK